jgi:hypothetical protein
VARIDARAERKLQELLHTRDKPAINSVAKALHAYCVEIGIKAPSRASVYNAVGRAVVPVFSVGDLPPAVQSALYNLDLSATATLRGDQLVFYAFNHGAPVAISFASALPWLCLERAARLRGWRPKSRTLLEAVMAYRGI